MLLALGCIAAGLFVEDIGSRIESRCFDKWLSKQPTFSAHAEEWNRYLRLAFKIEPVGQRYLRTILLRFKFELGTAIALLSSGVGLLLTTLPFWTAVTWLAVLATLAAYLLLVEARCSHELLSEIRHEILQGALVYPAEAFDGQQHAESTK